MSNRSQIESDEALARRIQEEELRAQAPHGIDGDMPGWAASLGLNAASSVASSVASNVNPTPRTPPTQPPLSADPFGIPFARGGPDYTTERMVSDIFRAMGRPTGPMNEPLPPMRDAMTGLHNLGDFPGRPHTLAGMRDPGITPTPRREDSRNSARNDPRNGARRDRRRQERPGLGAGLFGPMLEVLENAGRGATFSGATFTMGPDGAVRMETRSGGMGGQTNAGGGDGTGNNSGGTEGMGGTNGDGGQGGNRGTGNDGGGGNGGMGPEMGGMNAARDMMNMLFPGMRGGGNTMGVFEGDFTELFRSVFPDMGQGGGETYEDLINLMERMGGSVNRGASDGEIGNLPTNQFKRKTSNEDTECVGRKTGSDGAGPSSADAGASAGREAEEEKCAICLVEYEDGESVKRLPCTHSFHTECVDRWLKVNRICPLCTQSIRGSE